MSAAEPCSCRRENAAGRVAVDDLILELADIVGRIRCRLGDDDHSAYLGARASLLVHCLDAQLHPTAAEVFRANLRFADEQTAIEVALEDADQRAALLARLLRVNDVVESSRRRDDLVFGAEAV